MSDYYSRMEPIDLRQHLLTRTGDAALAEHVYRVANSERMYARQVAHMQRWIDWATPQLPPSEPEPQPVYLRRAPPESDG